MDLGALLHSMTGESIAPSGNSAADKTGMMNRLAGSQDIPPDDDPASFIQTIRRILESSDSGNGEPDDVGKGSERQASDIPQAMLVLELLGLGGIADLDSEAGTALDSVSGEDGNDYLAALLAQLAGASSGDIKGNADLLALLNKQMSDLAASMDMSATGSSDDTQNDARTILSILKIAREQGLDPDPAQSLKEQIDSLQMRMGADPSTLRNAGNDHPSGAGAVDQILSAGGASVDVLTEKASIAEAANNQAAVVDDFKKPTLGQLAEAKADQSAGLIDNAKTASQASLVAFDQIKHYQGAEERESEHNPDKSQLLEGAGLKKNLPSGESTVVDPNPADASSQNKEGPPSHHDTPGLHHSRHHQPLEDDPGRRPAPADGHSDGLLDGTTKTSLSADATMNSKPMTHTTAAGSFTQAAGDRSFQKTVMDQIVEKATIRSTGERSEIRIQLKPDALGDVRMSIVAEKNQLAVHLVADKSETKEIIESQINHLKAELEKQGITVGKIEVLISAGNDQQESRGQFFQTFGNNSYGNGKRHHRGQQQDPPPKHQPGDERDPDIAVDGINYFV